jgi:hypothetical protein
MPLQLLNPACLAFSSHLANRIKATVLSFVLLNIQERFWHRLYAFSISGYFSKSMLALLN